MKHRHTKAIIAFISIMAVFLIIEDATIISKQRDVLHKQASKHTLHELEIISSSMLADIMVYNYANVAHVLVEWGENHEEITNARAIAPNSFVIAEYQSKHRADQPVYIEHEIIQNGKALLKIAAIVDNSILNKTLKGLGLHMIASSIVFAILMGMALWHTQRLVALTPLERELSLRRETERRIKESHGLLEQRVEERTADLMQSEHSYRTLAVNLPGIAYRLTLNRQNQGKALQFFNETVYDMTGFHLDTLAEDKRVTHYWERVPNEDRARVRQEVQKAINEDRPFEVEYRFQHALGGTRYFLDRGRPVHIGETPSHIDGVVLDITKSRLSEKELERLYSTLYALVENIPVGIILLDRDSKIVLQNPIGKDCLQSLSGAGPGDTLISLCGQPLSTFLVNTSHLTSHEITTNDKAGRPVFYEAAARTISGERGIGGTVLMLRDVSEEHELSQWTQTHERLASVGQMAAGIAHDFGNVLTCVVGFSELLMTEKDLPDEAKRLLNAINESGQRGTDLINQILDFSKNATSDDRKPIDLTHTIRNFIKFMGRIIPENILVSVESSGDKPTIMADRTKIEQALANLIVNARDAMPQGGHIEFSLTNFQAGETMPEEPENLPPEMNKGDWIILKVSDTGEGIPDELRKHIFDPFFTTKGKGSGTGLGLAQVYGIIKQHGGHITVESDPGKGTRFYIFLPMEHADAVESLEDTAIRRMGKLPQGESQTVLVVEDDEVVRELMVTVLREMGHECLMGSNGEEGLGIFKQRSGDISLVVTDLVMPGMNGIQMSQSIKDINADMDIIAVSGYPPDNETGELDIFSTFIKKPFKAINLAHEVDRILKSRAT